MKPSINTTRIGTLKDVQDSIHILKKRVKVQEKDLSIRLKRLPEESFKATTGLFLPAFINNKISGGTWKLVKDGLGILSPFSSNKAGYIKDAAKQIGIMAFMKVVRGFIKK
ncbi:hypothetical protein [Parasediminibacterium sp. JCM 36343]|uniref:hypothetical protein n=1 Tax=Parasediminibacterium sp. JCM 36343 TaxID=3374279 RepID=UPI00397CC356